MRNPSPHINNKKQPWDKAPGAVHLQGTAIAAKQSSNHLQEAHLPIAALPEWGSPSLGGKNPNPELLARC